MNKSLHYTSGFLFVQQRQTLWHLVRWTVHQKEVVRLSCPEIFINNNSIIINVAFTLINMKCNHKCATHSGLYESDLEHCVPLCVSAFICHLSSLKRTVSSTKINNIVKVVVYVLRLQKGEKSYWTIYHIIAIEL